MRALLAALLLCTALSTMAQEPRTIAVLSLIGDSLLILKKPLGIESHPGDPVGWT